MAQLPLVGHWSKPNQNLKSTAEQNLTKSMQLVESNLPLWISPTIPHIQVWFFISPGTRMVQEIETCMKVNMLIGREKEEDVRAANYGNKWKEVEGQGNKLC
jgi:general stress protein 26